MNILLIEDEKDLAATGVAQLEIMGHEVAVVYDLEEAKAFMEKPDFKVDLVIADHRLPDGLGIDFVLEMRTTYTDCDYVIVSGCLTNKEIERLDAEGLLYYRKPFLYNKLIESFRRSKAMRSPARAPEPEGPPEQVEEMAPEPEKPVENKPKKGLGLFGFGKKK